jgi:hypothetical protein
VISLANNPYASNAAPPYPQAQQPSAPPTGAPPPPTAPGRNKIVTKSKYKFVFQMVRHYHIQMHICNHSFQCHQVIIHIIHFLIRVS